MPDPGITIRSVAKLKHRYQAKTDEGDYSFSEDTIIRFQIFKDKVFTRKEFDEILKTEQTVELYDKTLKYLTYQSRSTEEIRKYLQSKQANSEDTETILQKLGELGYLDDERFCREILDYCIRNRKGPKFLEMKLKEKGIESALIHDFRNQYDRDTETEVIREEAEKLLARYQQYPIRKQKLSLSQKLLRDGFRQEAINDILGSLSFPEGSPELLEKEYQRLSEKYGNLSDKERRNQILRLLTGKGYDYSTITALFEKKE